MSSIADVLWDTGEPVEAGEHYEIYKEMMIDSELTDQIPLRVYDRTEL